MEGFAEFVDLAPSEESFRDAALAGLARENKALPCRFLYDEAGSRLFDAICTLPEYYPTRTEFGILEAHAAEIALLAGPQCRLVEFGSGSSRKVRILLDALADPAGYVAVDISGEHLRQATRRLAAEIPGLPVTAICADYTSNFTLPDFPATSGRNLGFFPGSTIGNFEPGEAVRCLFRWARQLGPRGAMLIGVDLDKDPAILNAAYNDSRGVTAEFTRNILVRANRELGADFEVERFEHDAVYETDPGRITVHLRSLVPQSVTIDGRHFAFEAGEKLHIEYSYKYGVEAFRMLARRAGFRPLACWTDAEKLFSVHYLEVDF